MKWKYVVAWVPGVPIAIINGAVRQLWFRTFLDEIQAHRLSVLSFVVLFGIYVWYILRWVKPASTGEAVRVGLSWVGLTIAFEFLFGHFVMGHSWTTLLHDYNFFEGRLWVGVLLWVGLAPVVLFCIRRTRSATEWSRTSFDGPKAHRG